MFVSQSPYSPFQELLQSPMHPCLRGCRDQSLGFRVQGPRQTQILPLRHCPCAPSSVQLLGKRRRHVDGDGVKGVGAAARWFRVQGDGSRPGCRRLKCFTCVICLEGSYNKGLMTWSPQDYEEIESASPVACGGGEPVGYYVRMYVCTYT